MGTQFQRLTTPRAWDPEAMQADSARNLELTMSFPWPGCSCREDAGGLFDQGLIDVCGLGSQRRILTGTVPCALNSVLRGDHCPAVGSAPGASWDLTLTLTLTLPRPGPSTET